MSANRRRESPQTRGNHPSSSGAILANLEMTDFFDDNVGRHPVSSVHLQRDSAHRPSTAESVCDGPRWLCPAQHLQIISLQVQQPQPFPPLGYFTLCQAVVRTPRKLYCPWYDSGCPLYPSSTALTTNPLPAFDFGTTHCHRFHDQLLLP